MLQTLEGHTGAGSTCKLGLLAGLPLVLYNTCGFGHVLRGTLLVFDVIGVCECAGVDVGSSIQTPQTHFWTVFVCVCVSSPSV